MHTHVPGAPPVAVNFKRQVERNRIIDGSYPMSAMPRLSELLLDDMGLVQVKLEFGDSVGFASLKGRVSATIPTKCQRCMQPMEVEVEGRFKFALVNSEEDFELIPEEFEPYVLEDEEQSIIDIVEDELLLCIPMVTVHETDCSDFMKEQEERLKAEKESSHPFAALKALKGQH